MFLSVIIPAYNEEKHILSTLIQVANFLTRQGYPYEIVVVDDGSRDSTYCIAKSFAETNGNVLVLKNPKNEGKGAAVKNGIMAAQGEYILFTDADLSTPIEEIKKFLPLLGAGYDIVIGSRKIPGARIKLRQPAYREFMGKCFTAMASVSLGIRFSDITCGFKLFSRDAARRVFNLQRLNGWSFDAEILFIAKNLGLKIKELPVSWSDSPSTKVRLFADTLTSFAGIIKIRLNQLLGRY